MCVAVPSLYSEVKERGIPGLQAADSLQTEERGKKGF